MDTGAGFLEIVHARALHADLLAHAVDDDGSFRGHLQPYILRFQEDQELIQPMQSVRL